MSSNENLVIEVFKELAVLSGDRTTDGRWVSDNPWAIEKSLAEAMRIVERAKNSAK